MACNYQVHKLMVQIVVQLVVKLVVKLVAQSLLDTERKFKLTSLNAKGVCA